MLYTEYGGLEIPVDSDVGQQTEKTKKLVPLREWSLIKGKGGGEQRQNVGVVFVWKLEVLAKNGKGCVYIFTPS